MHIGSRWSHAAKEQMIFLILNIRILDLFRISSFAMIVGQIMASHIHPQASPR